MSLLEVSDLTLDFATMDGPVHALRGVSYSVEAGSVLGIVGESGSGKTASVLAAMRLLPSHALVTGGAITFQGRNLLSLREQEMRHLRGNKIAMIFQDPMTALNPVDRISKQLGETVEYHRRSATAREIRARVLATLEAVGVPDVARRATQYPHQWSGGMRQRAVIAMALLNEPDLILADEPTASLDATVQAQVLALLATAQHERGCAIVMISHDLALVSEIADKVVVMYAGQIAEQATTGAIFRESRHPYTRALLRARPGWGTRSEHLFTIPGRPPDLLRPPAACNFVERCAERNGLALCASAVPELRHQGPDHLAACHRSDDLEPMEVAQ
jgi:oligopeptide/dipeptide ABC transporter ATP-binding protein